MSTPTHTNLAQPTSASKKSTGHVTTPSYLGLSSPAPRSVPSPAATRKEQAGKTPVNHPTASSQGSKTLGSTPMVQNLSQASITASPGAQNAGYGTPTALGLGIIDQSSATPGLHNMPTPLVGGTSMIPTMSDLGFPTGAGKRNEDEERRLKMRKILKSIGRPKGRASQEAITRLSRRLGLDYAVDDSAIAISGQGEKFLVTVDLKQQCVRNVSVEIYSRGLEAPPVSMPEPGASASRVMRRNLAVPKAAQLQPNLDHFAVSLQSLAEVDQIGKIGGVNCFEALNGLYSSLSRLHEAEKAIAKQQQNVTIGNVDARAEMDVLCKKSGKASYHDNTKIGLALQYWTTDPRLGVTNDDAMDNDHSPNIQDPCDCQDRIYRIRIGIEECSASMYPPLRSSDAWLPEDSDQIVSGSKIQWQEPPPTYEYHSVAADHHAAPMDIDGAQSSLPHIRFVAKLDPPVIMPYPTILGILSSVGQQAPQVLMPVQYHAMLLDIPVQAVHAGTPITAKRSVFSFHKGQKVNVTQEYSLDIMKPEYGYKLEEIPFSHPRQLVELLPTLRQWAHFGALVQDAMKISNDTSAVAEVANRLNEAQISSDTTGINGNELDLDYIMRPSSGDSARSVDVHIGLSTSPGPALAFTYFNASRTTVCKAHVQVLPNADILVSDFDDGAGNEHADENKPQPANSEKFAKALAVARDLGVWIEWMRKQG